MAESKENRSIRYERQLMIPEIGESGQEKLESASVFLAGLGGLGATSALQLAASGIGHLKAVDKDLVELSNLNRQVIHFTDDIGRPKADSARDKLEKLNPNCRVEALHQSIDADNALALIGNCDIVVDATDNISTRRILNRACISLSKPLVFGGIHGFDGMVTTFVPGETPCLECLFPANKNIGECSKIPVLGAVPALVAAIQALEVIKYVTGIDGLLKQRLLRIRGTDMKISTTVLPKNPHCATCGDLGRRPEKT